MNEPKVVPQDEVVNMLEQEIQESLQELEHLMPQISHGEIKRLFMAVSKYPQEDADFTHDRNPAVLSAYITSKRLKDAMVGLATEVVIEGLIERQQAAQAVGISPEAPVVDQEEQPKKGRKKKGAENG